MFVSLLRTWVASNMPEGTVAQTTFDNLFVAHMNRGFELISSRMRSMADLQNIVPKGKAPHG